MTRRTPLVGLVALASLLALTGCAQDDGPQAPTAAGDATATRTSWAVDDFSSIDLRGVGDVTVEVGPRTSVRAEGHPEAMAGVVVEVADGTLILDDERGGAGPADARVAYRVTVPSLEGVTVSGDGSVAAADVSAGTLQASVPGSGTITLTGDAEALDARVEGEGTIDASGLVAEGAAVEVPGSGGIAVETREHLTAAIPGSGDITAAGAADRLEVAISGDGSFLGEGLRAGAADVEISGSGEVTLDVAERLDVLISGDGRVSYRGAPEVDQRITGSGTVRRR